MRQFSSTAGCTIPEPRISIHPVCLHVGHPAPWHTEQLTCMSADGSVNGKYDGENRVAVCGPKKLRANAERVALRSTNVTPSSTTSPSTCSNTGECEGSNGSRR